MPRLVAHLITQLASERAGSFGRRPTLERAVDRIGRGDAFAAGFLHGYLAQGPAEGLRYGAAMAALKQTYRGDVCLATPREVDAVLRGESGTFHR